MRYWPFWLGGVFLAAVPVAHWFLLHRMFGVSGRFTALTDWLRGQRNDEPSPTPEKLTLALRRETQAELGAQDGRDVVTDDCAAPQAVTGSPGSQAVSSSSTGVSPHLVFFIAVALGGTLSAFLAQGALPQAHGPDALFHHFFGSNSAVNFAVLFAGGTLVGFGTRMAGGCTSGHGLCGVSRLQPGSLVSTACFFGCGIVVSFLLRALLGGGV